MLYMRLRTKYHQTKVPDYTRLTKYFGDYFKPTLKAVLLNAAGPLWAQAAKGGENAFIRLVKNGKQLLKSILRHDVGQSKGADLPKQTWNLKTKALQASEKPSNLLGDFFSKYAKKTLASEFRRQTAFRLISRPNCRNVPTFGFVTLSLGASLAKKTDNEDAFSAGIRELFHLYTPKIAPVQSHQELSLDSLELGELIGKGCNAAVYEARPTNIAGSQGSCAQETTAVGNVEDPIPQVMPPTAKEYPLAVKMMFNYSVASDADQIRSAMARETVPSQHCPVNVVANENRDQAQTKPLPLHPNIVIMPGYFVDQTPYLSGGANAYPAALPSRLHEGGFGRNSTMFLVMKKYSMTLREFLKEHDISMRTRCVLFTQLLEGVQHLHQHAISHRDMKSDNILVDVSNGEDQPLLAICDFGCCLMESEHGFQIPYTTGEVSKGGNSALMAPEIKCANPGKRSVLDYSKADLWAAGALAYEIFGLENPFYGKEHKLDSRTYQEKDLPKLPDEVPPLVKDLVYHMLKRDSTKRPTPALAATIMQLHLWGAVYFGSICGLPKKSIKHLKWWLEQFVVQTMCQLVFSNAVASVELWLKHTFLSRITLQDLLLVCEDLQ